MSVGSTRAAALSTSCKYASTQATKTTTCHSQTLPAVAQVKYLDRNGQNHWVQTEDQILPEYRPNASRPRLPGSGQGDAEQRREYQHQLETETKERVVKQEAAERKAKEDEALKTLRARELMKKALDICEQQRRR